MKSAGIDNIHDFALQVNLLCEKAFEEPFIDGTIDWLELKFYSIRIEKDQDGIAYVTVVIHGAGSTEKQLQDWILKQLQGKGYQINEVLTDWS